jgi:SagB-type dehydrogenase family enzyme
MIPPFASPVLPREHSDEERVRAYHEQTKHRPDRFAPAPETLDWDSQPAPFRRFDGAPAVLLPLGATPETFSPLSLASLGTFLRLSLAITAWKTQGPDRWAVRANPSSGNLHPVEAYLIVDGSADLESGVYHYRPEDHALERRAHFRAPSPEGRTSPAALSIALTTIAWREVWKYGERGFRYCQLDVGHAMAAVAYAAAALGWRAREQRQLGSRTLARALGLDRANDFPTGRWADVEREEAEVLVAIELDAEAAVAVDPAKLEDAAANAQWYGTASRVDPRPMYEWPVIGDIMSATRSPRPSGRAAFPRGDPTSLGSPSVDVILGRRSAQLFDHRHEMSSEDFFGLLDAFYTRRATPRDVLGDLFPVDLLLFVQRVATIPPGVYVTAGHSPTAPPCLASRLRHRLMEPPLRGHPSSVELRLLARVDPRPLARLARGLHCNQNIVAQACFALGMVATFDAPIAEDPANYRRLHRQAGVLGHVLYLEAENRGLRGTGIGCFFDDAVHDIAGLSNTEFQSLYHFTVGKAAGDPHLEPAPPYPERVASSVTPTR